VQRLDKLLLLQVFFHRNLDRAPRQLLVAITLVLAFPAASIAQIRVLMSGGFSAAYHELLPRFENTTGIKVTTATGASQGDGPNTIRAQLRRCVPADMVILSREGLAGQAAASVPRKAAGVEREGAGLVVCS
jgi:molybdate transport system substrate-binding protein